GQHVHEVRDRRPLVAGDIADPALEQRLGDGEDALAAEFLARPDLELLYFLGEGAFGHISYPRCGSVCGDAKVPVNLALSRRTARLAVALHQSRRLTLRHPTDGIF